jgi:hypothetical protein
MKSNQAAVNTNPHQRRNENRDRESLSGNDKWIWAAGKTGANSTRGGMANPVGTRGQTEADKKKDRAANRARRAASNNKTWRRNPSRRRQNEEARAWDEKSLGGTHEVARGPGQDFRRRGILALV